MTVPVSIPAFPTPANIKMIVTDVDGTLLDSDHDLKPTNPTYKTLRRIRTTFPDLPIIISTGKHHRSTAQLRDQLDLHKFPCCHLNGNVIYSASGEILFESGLETGVVLRVIEAMQQVGTSVFVYDYTRVYQVYEGKGDTGQWRSMLRKYGELVEDETKDGIEKVRDGRIKVIKVGICQDEETLPVPLKVLECFPKEDFAITRALPTCTELIPASNNKGTALVKLLELMGGKVRPEEVVCFGDGENDISMFRVAGMPVAMGNAMKPAKEAAKYMTATNDEGGIGVFLQKVFWPVEN